MICCDGFCCCFCCCCGCWNNCWTGCWSSFKKKCCCFSCCNSSVEPEILNDKYEIIATVENGIFADIYKVKDRTDLRIKIVKRLNSQLVQDCVSQVCDIKNVDMVNMIKYLEEFTQKSYQYMVFEYTDAPTLRKEICDNHLRNTKISDVKIELLSNQILNGLRFLHSKNITHYEVTPSNIYLKNPSTIKLAEFSLARNKECFKHLIDKPMGMCYTSPEILNGLTADTKTDIWSFGCVFYEMVFLENAFNELDLCALSNKIKAGKIEYRNILSKKFKLVIESSLQINVSQRKTASELIKLLEEPDSPDPVNLVNPVDPIDELKKASDLYYKGENCRILKKLNESLDNHRKALEILLKYEDKNREKIDSFYAIGLVYHQLGKHFNAIKAFKKALELVRKDYSDSDVEIGCILHNIGLAYDSLNNYFESRKYHYEALCIRKKLSPVIKVDVALSLTKLANACEQLRCNKEAADYYNEAYDIRKEIYPGLSVEKANLLFKIGVLLYRNGDYNDAIINLEECLKQRKNIFYANNPEIAETYLNIGYVYEKMTDYTNALQNYLESFNICVNLNNDKAKLVIKTLSRIIDIYERLEDKLNEEKYRSKLSEFLKKEEVISTPSVVNKQLSSSFIY